MNPVVLVTNTMVILTTALAVGCIAFYLFSAHGMWWRTEMGRHLAAWMTSFALVLLVSSVRIVAGASLDTPWFGALRIIAFATTPIVFGWRLNIMIRLWRAGREEGVPRS